MKKKSQISISTYFWLLPGVGYIVFFLSITIIMMVLQSFGFFSLMTASQFSFKYWQYLFDRQFLDCFLFSLKIGLGGAFGALIFSYPLALLMRKSFIWKKTLGSILKIPLFIPALVASFLIINLVAYHGILNAVLLKLGFIQEPLRMLHDKWGISVIFVQIWKNIPFQLLIISSVVVTIRTDIEEAARNLGANSFAVFRYIIFPLSIPGILVAVIIVFIFAFGDYPITKVAGPTYPTSLSIQMQTISMMFMEWNKAACIGVIIMVASAVSAAFFAKLAKIIQGVK
jgi:putative spermidine/putrescine transport system permease protein